MGRFFLKDNGEEHNFWQNYTDLMSGFLIVFIITSLVAYVGYKSFVDIFTESSNGEVTVQDVIVNDLPVLRPQIEAYINELSSQE